MPPSAEVLAEREHAKEVREVMKILTQLPRGLPTAFWSWDLSALAKEIVDGEHKTAPDGTPLVFISGKWYVADVNNVGTFLQWWKDEAEKPSALDDDDRAKKLDLLEERLLDGKISEETYDRLRKKYKQ